METSIISRPNFLGMRNVSYKHCREKKNTNHLEITNKMQPCTRIYYSIVLSIPQHVSSDTPLIIRSLKTVNAASGFAYVCKTNKMQPCTRIYYSSVLLVVQHVSSDTPLIIKSLKTVIAASGFAYVYKTNKMQPCTRIYYSNVF